MEANSEVMMTYLAVQLWEFCKTLLEFLRPEAKTVLRSRVEHTCLRCGLWQGCAVAKGKPCKARMASPQSSLHHSQVKPLRDSDLTCLNHSLPRSD